MFTRVKRDSHWLFVLLLVLALAVPAVGALAAPAAAPALSLSQLAQFGDYLSQNPVAQDISHGLYQGWYGNGDIVKTTSPHEQLARELYARGIYDPRLGVPEQALRGF